VNLYAKIVSSIAHVMTWISVCILTAMMILACTDVVFRYFGHPVTGAYDITRVLGILIFSLPIAYSCIENYQVAVDSVFRGAPLIVRIIVDSIVCLCSMAMTVIVAWSTIYLGNDLRAGGRVTDTVPIPLWPFVYIVSLGFFVYCFVILAKHLGTIEKTGE
jgi:TRAP-type C4-dicarboxylate transport system permease small subunit